METNQFGSINVYDFVPFDNISDINKKALKEQSIRKTFDIGDRLCRNDEYGKYVYIIISGEARVIGTSRSGKGLITIGKVYRVICGWSSLLRGRTCETVQACTKLETYAIH